MTVSIVVMNIEELQSGSCQNTLFNVLDNNELLSVSAGINTCCRGCGFLSVHITSVEPSWEFGTVLTSSD